MLNSLLPENFVVYVVEISSKTSYVSKKVLMVKNNHFEVRNIFTRIQLLPYNKLYNLEDIL